jgi:apolipoprotein N-acyltransferase
MNKVWKRASAYIFGAFGFGVFGLVLSLTYSALTIIFPNDLINHILGLVLFDISAVAWGLAFVYLSETVTQYAIAALGFLTGFGGTLIMVAAAVWMSSGLAAAGTDISRWVSYGFIVVATIHLTLIYAHQANKPAIHEQIEVGIARGGIVARAIQQARDELEQQQEELARMIYSEIVERVKRELGLDGASPVPTRLAAPTMPLRFAPPVTPASPMSPAQRSPMPSAPRPIPPRANDNGSATPSLDEDEDEKN